MITEVQKRDGRIEAFDPSKMMAHLRWAEDMANGRVDIRSVLTEAMEALDGRVTSAQIQAQIIQSLLNRKTWTANLIAGSLYASDRQKSIYPNGIPTLKAQYEKLLKLGYARRLDYSDSEWEFMNSVVDHSRDFHMDHAQLKQILKKYCLTNQATKEVLETPQFEMARMASALAIMSPPERRMKDFKTFYMGFSSGRVNAPTPNHLYLGTPHTSFVSCCLYQMPDTQAGLTATKVLVDMMTNIGAGLGAFINTRSPGDPIRGGKIIHRGKFPYLQTLQSQVKESEKAGRDGAITMTFQIYDPEALALIMAQNPRTPETNQLRRMHFSFSYNDFFVKKAYTDEPIFTFNVYTAPKLMECYHDPVEFEKEYLRLEADPGFKKNYVNALDLLTEALRQEHEVSTLYEFNATEVNRHTPFLEYITNSNLCQEIQNVCRGYTHVMDLYSTEDHGRGEVGLCSLGAVNVADDPSDEELKSACYTALRMVDCSIELSDYPFPHMQYTARARRNAAIGIVGLAALLAKKNLRYGSKEALEFTNRLSERMSYFLIESALEQGIEYGNAEWMHKTKWPQGWLPIDTYNRHVDELVSPELHMPWEELRTRIIANGGIRFSTLMADMPTESSSKALPGVPNGPYPVRSLSMLKSDQSNVLDWVVRDSDTIGHQYTLAYDLTPLEQIHQYAVRQKWMDQSASADRYTDRIARPQLSEAEELELFFARHYYGLKTVYYSNSLIPEVNGRRAPEPTKGCASGACDV